MIQFLLITLIIINAFLFTQTNHPLSIGLILLIQTILRCGLSGIITKNFWFSYILFLVFIGGILILFIYIASLASNEKIKFNKTLFIKLRILITTLIIIIMILDKNLLTNICNNIEITLLRNHTILIKENLLRLSKLYDKPNFIIILFIINYLLLTLIAVVKISNTFLGPLRPKSI